MFFSILLGLTPHFEFILDPLLLAVRLVLIHFSMNACVILRMEDRTPISVFITSLCNVGFQIELQFF